MKLNDQQISEYVDLFILCLESAGAKTGDEFLMRIEDVLVETSARDILNGFNGVGQGLAIMDVVTLLLLSSMIGKKVINLSEINLSEINSFLDNKDTIIEEIKNLFNDYLADATHIFCDKHGLKIESNLSNLVNGKDLFSNEEL